MCVRWPLYVQASEYETRSPARDKGAVDHGSRRCGVQKTENKSSTRTACGAGMVNGRDSHFTLSPRPELKGDPFSRYFGHVLLPVFGPNGLMSFSCWVAVLTVPLWAVGFWLSLAGTVASGRVAVMSIAVPTLEDHLIYSIISWEMP